MFAHWSVMRERFISNGFYTVSNVMMNFYSLFLILYQERFSVTFKKSRQTSVLAKSAYNIRYVRVYMGVDAAHQRLENPNRCSLAHYSALYKRSAMGSKNETFVYHISRRL